MHACTSCWLGGTRHGRRLSAVSTGGGVSVVECHPTVSFRDSRSRRSVPNVLLVGGG